MDAQVKDIGFDLDAILPLELIRSHTGTTDVVTMTNDLLRMYRESAFEAAQDYTGLWFRGRHWQVQPVHIRTRPGAIGYRVKLDRPAMDGVVHLYGSAFGGNRTIRTSPMAREVNLPLNASGFSFNQCCNPCAQAHEDRLAYWTGYGCAADVPAGVVEGMLRYIAFVSANAGDVGFAQVSGRSAVGLRTISNDPIAASGAGSVWMRYRTVT